MTRLGILTGGGDAPGLNAVIRAVVRTAIGKHQAEILGIRDGFDGLLADDGVYTLTLDDVRGILPRGGTILGTANRGNPFGRRVVVNGQETIVDVSEEVLNRIQELDLDCLIVVGGDGTLRIAHELSLRGAPVLGVPKTIDNDVAGTDYSFGFDTAVDIAAEALDRLHSTAEAHHRVMVLELMGRQSGFIALHGGLAGGADVILLPEIPFDRTCVAEKIRARQRIGRSFSLVAAAEGAHPTGGEPVMRSDGDGITYARMGGISYQVADMIAEDCQVESRALVLGHLQRGGSPSAFDRWLGTCFGSAVVDLAMAGRQSLMVALQGTEIHALPLGEAMATIKQVDPEGQVADAARGLGICLGDGACLRG
jgi:6-phosphofructokinase 1